MRTEQKESQSSHVRYYAIAGIAIRVESELPITDSTFHPKFRHFEVDGPVEDAIVIRHHIAMPDWIEGGLGKEIHGKPPWKIYQREEDWIYLCVPPGSDGDVVNLAALVRRDHSRTDVYHGSRETLQWNDHRSLSLFPTDQVLLAPVLARRRACYLHACGAIYKGAGLVFMGHSDAGKSTMATMLKDHAEILCDDRIIIRKWSDGFKVHGTWCHGDVPIVSAKGAPLKAVLHLEKARENRLLPIADRRVAIQRLLACLIKPLRTADWWNRMLTLVEIAAREAPHHILRFDRSGAVVELLDRLLKEDS